MSLQVCHCGWSKVTTYHGLRTHQGKMRCGQPAAISTSSLQQAPRNVVTPSQTPQAVNTSDMSLQMCHCGWSKVTTHHGLRTHQGKMGCTPQQGPRESWGSVATYQTPVWNSVQAVNTSDTSLQVCHCGWSKVTTYHGLRTHQGKMGCTLPATESSFSQQQGQRESWEFVANFQLPVWDSLKPSATPVKRTLSNHVDSVDASKSLLETLNFQVIDSEVCRKLDFSTVLPEVGQLFDLPSATSPQTQVPPQQEDKDRINDTQAELKETQNKIWEALQHSIQMREEQITHVTASAKAVLVNLDAEWQEVNKVFSDVMRVVEDARQKALRPLEDRKNRVKKEEEDLIQKLQVEIDKIREIANEFDKTQGGLEISPDLDETQDWINETVTSSFTLASLVTVTSRMMQEIEQEKDKLSSLEIKRISLFAVDVRFDPLSAHRRLIISPDGKTVRDGEENQNVPSAAERFDTFASILGLNVLTSGKAYWEVDVRGKTGWDLGVARRGANRRGKLRLTPHEGFWVLVHCEGYYAAMSAPVVHLPLTVKPQKVGVFVDFEQGLVSFYNVTHQSHIYSFTKCPFRDGILPYFSPHLRQKDENSEPLIIAAVGGGK